jgi:sulfite reductase (NADPH) flavoprotein alpha-component
MTIQQALAEHPFTLETWEHVEALTRSLTAEQARWISGYFAGFDAALARAGDSIAPESQPSGQARTLTILYGTETGNGRSLAKGLAEAATARGLTAGVADLGDYKARELKNEQDLLFIVSTYGEGDPPQPAVGFFEFLEGARAPRLDAVRYSVLALGDSTYEKYCEAGKRIDARLEVLGAKRLHDRVDCDVDYDDLAGAWSGAVIDRLAAELAIAAPRATPAVARKSSPTACDKKNPFLARVLDRISIVGRDSTKETRHVEIDLAGSGLTYEPGDALGVVPRNDPTATEQLLVATGLSGDARVTVRDEALSLADALESRFEVTIASPRFLDSWAELSGTSELEALRGPDQAADRVAYHHDHHVVDIVRQFPVPGIAPEQLLAGLRPLQPRLYSIASSLAAVPDEAHLTISPVRYDLHGERRHGVASTQFADRLEPGDEVPVYIQHNPHFSLPKDDAPIIMIGAGTGVAPYRGFLQHREVEGGGGNSWLFFGERNFRSDFLYQAEWQQWLKEGVLSRMDVAFSRDATLPKAYVQDRLLERADDLVRWIEDGAHVYVCGDEKGMARDVHATLVKIIADEWNTDIEAGEAYLRKLRGEHRYQRDVY